MNCRKLTERDIENRTAAYLPTPDEIVREAAIIRAENEARQQGKAYQPPVDADCDAELEDEADRECRKR